jgi:flagellar hook protein FlgE
MFILSDSRCPGYTRAGAFQMNRDGYVVNSDGPAPAGLSADSRRRFQHRRSQRPAPADHGFAPAGHANVEYVLNLPASATAAVAVFDPTIRIPSTRRRR